MSDLTVAYLWTEGLDSPEHFVTFMDAFKDSNHTPRAFPGVVGDMGAGRCAMFRNCESEFICMVDPDDVPVPDMIDKCVQYLRDNPDVAACCPHEKFINRFNESAGRMPLMDFSLERHYRTPLEFHSQIVFRREIVLRYVDQVESTGFYDADWALKLMITTRHPVHKFKEYGYSLRRRRDTHSSGRHYRDHLVHPDNTLSVLLSEGLIPPLEDLK